MFITALFAIERIWQQPKCRGTAEWLKELWYIYMIEYCTTVKQKKVMKLTYTQIDKENIMLREMSQRKSDRQNNPNQLWHIRKIKRQHDNNMQRQLE